MCWNASVSINTYTFSLFASIFAYINNVINAPTFWLFQSFFAMQLVEYFIWSKTFPNWLLAVFSMLLVLLQPILSINRISKKYTTYKFYLFCGYALLLILWFGVLYPIDKIDFRIVPHKNGHLAWNWIMLSPEMIFVWVFFLLFPLFIIQNYLLLSFAFITFLITYIYYSESNTWGSMWCWVANAISLFLIIKVFMKELCIWEFAS